MADVAVMLRVSGRRCVVVGGGAVAARRGRALVEAGADVVVVAPEVRAEVEALGCEVRRRAVEAADLAGAFLVVLATGDPGAARLVDACGAPLVNRADEAEAGDVQFMAAERAGPVTLAVHTGGASAAAAAAIRDEVARGLDADWPRLLEAAAPYRAVVRRRFADADERRTRLRGLTDAAAVAMLKAHGPDALRRHLERVADPARPMHGE